MATPHFLLTARSVLSAASVLDTLDKTSGERLAHAVLTIYPQNFTSESMGAISQTASKVDCLELPVSEEARMSEQFQRRQSQLSDC